jgi:hypothetical protein
MQTSDVESGNLFNKDLFKKRFKSSFKKAMDTVSLENKSVGQKELQALKDQIVLMYESKTAEVRRKCPGPIDVYFATEIGRISFPDASSIKVFVDDYSPSYPENINYISTESEIKRDELLSKSYLKREIEFALNESLNYNSAELHFLGKRRIDMQRGISGVRRLNIGLNVRTDNLYIMTAINDVDYASRLIRLFINMVKPNGREKEGAYPEYEGMDSIFKSHLLKKILYENIVNGREYSPLSTKPKIDY